MVINFLIQLGLKIEKLKDIPDDTAFVELLLKEVRLPPSKPLTYARSAHFPSKHAPCTCVDLHPPHATL